MISWCCVLLYSCVYYSYRRSVLQQYQGSPLLLFRMPLILQVFVLLYYCVYYRHRRSVLQQYQGSPLLLFGMPLSLQVFVLLYYCVYYRHRRSVIQQYKGSPLLLFGMPLSLQVFVLVTSVLPLTAYIHSQGLAQSRHDYKHNFMKVSITKDSMIAGLIIMLTKDVNKRHIQIYTLQSNILDSRCMFTLNSN